MNETTIFIAFLAGIASFLSPCILPLVPVFISYMTGITGKQVEKGMEGAKLKIFLNTIFFVLGFSLVFSVLGIVLGSLLSSISYDVKLWMSKIGGIIIIAFGLYLVGALKLKFLEGEHHIGHRKFSSTYLTSFVFGAVFAAGWTPCVGAILGSVLTLAIINPGSAFFLLLAYALGISVPFLIAGLFISQMSSFLKKLGPFLKYFNIVMGIVLIILGILILTDQLAQISNFGFASGIMG
ncbi:sulfite exporter TauE/SafE family protein [Candidatus Micrarchaeota archaeon]|nr:sulfite exporter TauE/SafE family protein [Candidatus Micrarchaeota archaeon]